MPNTSPRSFTSPRSLRSLLRRVVAPRSLPLELWESVLGKVTTGVLLKLSGDAATRYLVVRPVAKLLKQMHGSYGSYGFYEQWLLKYHPKLTALTDPVEQYLTLHTLNKCKFCNARAAQWGICSWCKDKIDPIDAVTMPHHHPGCAECNDRAAYDRDDVECLGYRGFVNLATAPCTTFYETCYDRHSYTPTMATNRYTIKVYRAPIDSSMYVTVTSDELDGVDIFWYCPQVNGSIFLVYSNSLYTKESWDVLSSRWYGPVHRLLEIAN
jgi:hypothetical protein